MHRNRSAILIVVVIIIMVILGVMAYLASSRKPIVIDGGIQDIPPPAPIQKIPQAATSTAKNYWESLLLGVKKILVSAFADTDVRVEESRLISVFKSADITGDDIPEALINLGTGGASTDLLVLMMVKNGEPSTAYFRQKNGTIVSPLTLSEGAGGAGRYGSATEMDVENHVIRTTSYSAYGDGSDFCEAEAYKWNSEARVFEFDEMLSAELLIDSCKDK